MVTFNEKEEDCLQRIELNKVFKARTLNILKDKKINKNLLLKEICKEFR